DAGTATSSASNLAAFRQGLSELGYVEGQDIVLEVRYAEGRTDALTDLATELVSQHLAVIVATTGAAMRAMLPATSAVPVVFTSVLDPVEQGFVASLARPGGNATGLTISDGLEIIAKRLSLLKDTVPGLSHVAVPWSRGQNPRFIQVAAEAARGLRLQIL